MQRAGGVVKQTPPPGDGAAGRPPLAAGVRPAWLAGGGSVCGVAASWEPGSRGVLATLFFFLGQNFKNETRQVYARKAHKERLVQDFKSLPTHRQLYNMPN